jgi:hypothetical protein
MKSLILARGINITHDCSARLFIEPSPHSSVVGAGTAAGFAFTIGAVFALSGCPGRLCGAVVGFADDVAGGVFVGAVRTDRLLLLPFVLTPLFRFAFFTLAGFRFVTVSCLGPKHACMGDRFDFSGAVVPDDVNDAGRRGSPAQGRFNFDLIGTDVEMKPVVPVAGVDRCFGAVDGD